MKETSFQSSIIKNLIARGYSAYNMETNQPGFPDIFATKKDNALMIEVKCEKVGPRRRVISLLEDTQPPFWLRYLENNDNLFLVIKQQSNKIKATRITKEVVLQITSGVKLGDLPGGEYKTIGGIRYE